MIVVLRNVVYALIALGILYACNTQSIDLRAEETLKDAGDFPIGTAFNIGRLLENDTLVKIVVDNFNSITSGSDMKMNRVLPAEGEYNWEQVDSMLAFAREHEQRFFGHTLIWHSSTPEWVMAKAAADSMWLATFMREYIHTFVGRYRGKVQGWDVVNEGMNTFGGGYRETIWYNTLGKDYIANAFRYAHEADPEAVLFYNDFNIERDTAKLHSVLQMIDELKADGVPISGLGFQMHIRMDIPDSVIAYSLKKGAETGLQIHLSEVDIIFNTHNDAWGGGIQLFDAINDSMLYAQAEKYRNLVLMYKNIVPQEQQYGITLWGFNDRRTWIRGFFNIMDWPCLWDDKLQPKPAYYGFLEGLKSN